MAMTGVKAVDDNNLLPCATRKLETVMKTNLQSLNVQKLNRRELIVAGVGLAAGLILESGLGVVSRALPALPTPDFDHDPIQTVKLSDTLSVLMGMGGNIAVLTGEDGTVQIDSGVPSRATDIAQAIAVISSKPVATLINTHWHFDHTGGNEAVGKAGARIVAQNNTRKRLASAQRIDFYKMDVQATPHTGLPTLTFADSILEYANGEELALTHVAPAHTDTDIFIHFRQANVIHAGDLLFNGFYPFIDYSSGGWIGGMVAGCDHLLAAGNANTRYIPGHGPMATRADVQNFRTMLATVQGRIAPMLKAGRTEAETVAAKPTKDLDAKWGHGAFTSDQFVAIVYRGLAQRGHAKTSA